jgi:hypothetical protein
MSEVFRTVSFLYDGREVTLTPSIALLRRLKAAGINNMLLATQCVKGGADALDLITVHRAFLQEGGTFISEDESYAWLTGGNVEEIMSFQSAYVSAVLPGVDLGKKPDAPAPKKAKPKRNSQT